MIEKTFIDQSLSKSQIAKKYDIPLTTAFDARKRGYLAKKVKTINVSEEAFNIKEAITAAEYIFHKDIKKHYPVKNMLDDLRQESLLRCFELSGNAKPGKRFNYYCKISHFAMINYLTKIGIAGIMRNRIVSFEDNVLGKGIYS